MPTPTHDSLGNELPEVDEWFAEQKTYSTEHIVSLHGDPVWQAIWNAIKGWDISRTGAGSYHAPTGDDATHIYEAVKRRCEICGSGMSR